MAFVNGARLASTDDSTISFGDRIRITYKVDVTGAPPGESWRESIVLTDDGALTPGDTVFRAVTIVDWQKPDGAILRKQGSSLIVKAAGTRTVFIELPEHKNTGSYPIGTGNPKRSQRMRRVNSLEPNLCAAKFRSTE